MPIFDPNPDAFAQTPLPYETGIISTDGWTTVSIQGTFTDPIVIAQPIDGFETSALMEYATAVVRNVSSSSFEVQLYRGDSTGGSIAGDVGYIVVEKGNHTLPDGTQMQAGSVDISRYDSRGNNANRDFTQINFSPTFSSAPTFVATANKDSAQDWVSVRYQSGSLSGNSVTASLEIDESYPGGQLASNVGDGTDNEMGWLAIERGTFDGIEAALTTNISQDPGNNSNPTNWKSLGFANTYSEPVFFAIASHHGGDPTTIGRNNLSGTGVDIRVTEDTAANAEQGHATGQALWVVFESTPATSVPGQPLNISATAGPGQVTVSWSAPNSNGGAEIDYYTVQYRESGVAEWTTFGNTPDGNTTSLDVTSLTPGTIYEFQVLAHNSAGNSNPSGAANATPLEITYELPLSEEFTLPSLNPAVDENISSSILGWTHVAPSGWSIQSSSHTETSGTTEWRGWSFTTMEFWTAADQQDRGAFSKASGTFAVADPDEWDDTGNAANSGDFDSTLSSPSVEISSGDNELTVSFDSHYKQEGDQTAVLSASFADSNGSVIETVELLRYDDGSSDNDGSHVLDTTETLTATIPANADSVVLSWRLFDAGNNWYWAIDNVAISSGVASSVPGQPFNVSASAGNAQATIYLGLLRLAEVLQSLLTL